jgi:hypothetical protein
MEATAAEWTRVPDANREPGRPSEGRTTPQEETAMKLYATMKARVFLKSDPTRVFAGLNI